MFADDAKFLYLRSKNDASVFQNDLQILEKWCCKNQMGFNPNKENSLKTKQLHSDELSETKYHLLQN